MESIASGIGSHAEGSRTTATGGAAHAEGFLTEASEDAAHAEGIESIASGVGSHAEGNFTAATKTAAHAEGFSTQANDSAAHAEGIGSIADGFGSHAEGNSTTAIGSASHAEGRRTRAANDSAHAEGMDSIASGPSSHAEGQGTEASGLNSHAEGFRTRATNNMTHAEGAINVASGPISHAEGQLNTANGNISHVEGSNNTAGGAVSHVEGQQNISVADLSHVEGLNNVANHFGSHIMGTNGATRFPLSWHLANGLVVGPTLNAAVLQGSTGNLFLDGAVISPAAADYAEMFETSDGLPIDVGYFVTFHGEGEMIRKATAEDEYILGVVSATPAMIADASDLRWHDLFLKDEWGRIQYHEVVIPELKEPDGTVTRLAFTKSEPVLNPAWDPTAEYVSRLDRPEWVPVGIVGKLRVRDDGTCSPGGYCFPNAQGIGTVSTTGFRVMKRTGPNQVLIFINEAWSKK
ncbi:hypothetical protein BSK65_22090 [Paenibacillus odorifer]|uniref:Peptidase G2 IMC autoproteolytic cleavage domain-containing protein n=1 Tax=Paenibacillus odorifer TaxID=189426 RepID=A0A1R0ZCC7_9BACL|nr:hypothetical protein BSK51_20665 [Paenibacillus odorifer]OME66723.1 hypothetical protein BSK65_22090 [Paenibacillus odorifer]